MNFSSEKIKICVVGLGYVGLPLAVEFGKKFETIGYDINEKRINELRNGYDRNEDVNKELLKSSKVLYTTDYTNIKESNFIVIAMPTPIDKKNDPDLSMLKDATEVVGKNMSKNTIIVYESTVWPGTTEDICVPILENSSGLKHLIDFKVGYSPERVNPGDKLRTIDKIVKVVSGADEDSLKLISKVYSSVISAGVYEASSIKVAEAAKIIENTQRDINIALFNELSMIFNRLGLDTYEVIEAAATKWNFIKMTPGLVGGHCIGVDPYYLAHKAKAVGHFPKIILSGRQINDNMPFYVANKVLDNNPQSVLVLGVAFKEDVRDTRNSKTFDIIKHLKKSGVDVDAYDPMVEDEDMVNLKEIPDKKYDAVIVSVPHKKIKEFNTNNLIGLVNKGGFVFDLKKTFDKKQILDSERGYWSL